MAKFVTGSVRLDQGDRVTKSKDKKLPPIHPGEILREDYMKPLGLSSHRLAMVLRVPATRISEIVHERRSISADTAVRLGRYFRTSARFWLNLQTAYDLEIIDDQTLAQIENEVGAGV
jgi:antitoxin HigA-1